MSPCVNEERMRYCDSKFRSQSCIHRIDDQCRLCPTKNNLSSWREKEDVEFSATCSDPNSAVVNFNLEKMHEVGWMEDVNIELKLYKEGALQNKTVIEDIHTKKLYVDMTLADKLCLEFTKGPIKSQPFCKVWEISFAAFSRQLNRRPCHSLTHSLTRTR